MSKSVSVWRKLLSIYTEYVDLLEWHTETNVQKKLLKASIQYILFSTACGQCTYSKHFGKCACTSHQSDVSTVVLLFGKMLTIINQLFLKASANTIP